MRERPLAAPSSSSESRRGIRIFPDPLSPHLRLCSGISSPSRESRRLRIQLARSAFRPLALLGPRGLESESLISVLRPDRGEGCNKKIAVKEHFSWLVRKLDLHSRQELGKGGEQECYGSGIDGENAFTTKAREDIGPAGCATGTTFASVSVLFVTSRCKPKKTRSAALAYLTVVKTSAEEASSAQG